MTPGELLYQGFELMLFGLGIVFLFLILLVYAIKLMSVMIARFIPTPVEPAVSPQLKMTSAGQQDIDGDLLAAIQSAIHQHRGRRG